MPELTPNAPRPNERPTPPSQLQSVSKRGSAVWIWIVVLVVVGIAAIIFFRHRSRTQAEQTKGAGGPPPPMVTTVISSKGDIGIYVNALGTVTPLNTVAVKTRVDGQLMKVNYEEGQLVKAGDPLLDIDARPFEAALEQVQGQLTRDRALLENARLDLSRYQEAFAKNAIPKQQLDTQASTVHQYEGAVRLDEGQVSNAMVQLDYSHITAPISGRVGLRLVDPGNIVHASDTSPLAVITQLQPITVIFNVSEDYLGQIQGQLRQGKTLAVDAFDRAQQKKLASGVLKALDNQIDTTTGTVKLRAIFTNEDSSLFPNEFVNARLLVDTLRDATLVPNPVIQRDTQGAFVYLLNPDHTVSTNPVVVKVTDSDVSAVEGLEPGKVLVADNFNRLTDGMKVSVRSSGGEQHGGTNPPNGEAPLQGGGKKKRQQK